MNRGLVTGVLITLAVVLLLNVVVTKLLLRIHPRRRRTIAAAAIAGNLFWLLIPLMSFRTTSAFRVARALLAPPWFTWAMFVLLYALFAAIIWFFWVLLRRKVPLFDFAARPSRIWLMVLAIALVIGCWQALVPLRVERVPVTIADLPAGLRGMRLVLLSDLHVGLFTRMFRLDQISEAVNELRPDLVLVSGDLIDDDPFFAPKLVAGFRKLQKTTPLFAVLGNHDIYGDPKALIGRLNGSRIRLLVNEGVPLQRGGATLWLAGTSDYAANREQKLRDLAPDLRRALAGRPAAATTILLSHQPKIFGDAMAAGIPLTLAGHTHGGQCGFRPLRLSLAGVFLPYHMGLYEQSGSQLYINTGTGFWVIPFRLGMTPEITVVELQ